MAILSTVRAYTPKVGDNHLKSENERIVVYLKNLTVKDKQTRVREFITKSPDELTRMMLEDKGSEDIKKLLFDNVVRIEGLILDDEQPDPQNPGQFVKVSRAATAQDLWEQGEQQLCVELFMNIISGTQLSKDQEKNSESQSGSGMALSSPVREGVLVP